MEDKVRYRVWVKRGGGYTPTGHEPFRGMYESIARDQCARYLKDGEDFYVEKVTTKVERIEFEDLTLEITKLEKRKEESTQRKIEAAKKLLKEHNEN